jgi:deoxycytidylate deaminase
MTIANDSPELMIGLVSPVGIYLDWVQNALSDFLNQFGYDLNVIKISSLIKNVKGLKTVLVSHPEFERIDSHMTAGNEARLKARRGDILAALAMWSIQQKRNNEDPMPRTAHLFRSLKHPDEVQLLRDIYGDGFYLLGIASSRSQKLKYLTEQKGISPENAEKLIKRDESEETALGQHMRDAFHLADCFIDIDAGDTREQIARFLDIVFGKPCVTPTKDEYAMFLAFAASLRSGDLSRQVGAVVTTQSGEVVSTGANDVPCYGGGLYWADSGELDMRDYRLGRDCNEERRNKIAVAIMRSVNPDTKDTEAQLLEKGRELLKNTGVFDITEYGRAVHAEMEALLACARSGVSPMTGTLYTTTFPCHNCAKHIIAAGLKQVVFVEPYPKSLAMELHSDAIDLAHETESPYTSKVRFKPFVGMGPRRFIDLFSMTLSSGRKIKREQNGVLAQWDRKSASVRVPLSPISYIERETKAVAEFDEWIRGE